MIHEKGCAMAKEHMEPEKSPDWEALGLKVGLEIHQQLDTGKLFCSCPSILSEPIPGETLLVRSLRAAKSELGDIDGAASEAAAKNMVFHYQAPSHTCLVEADEEPPHEVTNKALEACTEMCHLFGSEVVPEIQFMRKIVIDGSNTAGFQRTALVARKGSLRVKDSEIGISTVCLEEDAARRLEQKGSEITYRLDRLGIPLIEIATDPVIRTPGFARDVALRLGTVLRATKKVKRGIGTIREDINISITGGARVEIKGVQEPALIATYIENEVKRQLGLIEARDELVKRGIKIVGSDIIDCTDLLNGSKSKVIAGSLDASGVVLGVKLPGFSGLLKDLLGPELADYARTAGVAGLFHSDELPGYGITRDEVSRLESFLGIGKGSHDAFAIVADSESKARRALEAAVRRAGMALLGVPEETRDPLPGGGTAYSRPLPGRARMYPETDVPPFRIPQDMHERIRRSLPEMPEVKIARFEKVYGISSEQAEQLVAGDHDGLFEMLAGKHGKARSAVIARTLLNTIPELEKDGVPAFRIDGNLLDEVFSELVKGAFAKEGIPKVLAQAVLSNVSVQEAVKLSGLGAADTAELDRVLTELVNSRSDLIKQKGDAAVGPLMGEAMKTLRGKIDGKILSDKLREKVREALGETK